MLIVITYKGKEYTIKELAKHTNVPPHKIYEAYSRLSNSPEKLERYIDDSIYKQDNGLSPFVKVFRDPNDYDHCLTTRDITEQVDINHASANYRLRRWEQGLMDYKDLFKKPGKAAKKLKKLAGSGGNSAWKALGNRERRENLERIKVTKFDNELVGSYDGTPAKYNLLGCGNRRY